MWLSLEETTMHSMLRTFALAAIAATATTAFAFDAVTVNVPFSFESQGKIYPAGGYDVSLGMNNAELTLRSKTATKKAMMLALSPADYRPGAPILRIKFDAVNGTYNLRTIQYAGYITPVLDAKVKHGKTVELPFGGDL
jgi:hypothetical protein